MQQARLLSKLENPLGHTKRLQALVPGMETISLLTFDVAGWNPAKPQPKPARYTPAWDHATGIIANEAYSCMYVNLTIGKPILALVSCILKDTSLPFTERDSEERSLRCPEAKPLSSSTCVCACLRTHTIQLSCCNFNLKVWPSLANLIRWHPAKVEQANSSRVVT